MKQTKQQIESFAYYKIKANDKILQTLSELETVLRKLYDPIKHENLPDLNYKTSKGFEQNEFDFFDDLQHFIDKNELLLQKDSAEQFEIIKKITK